MVVFSNEVDKNSIQDFTFAGIGLPLFDSVDSK